MIEIIKHKEVYRIAKDNMYYELDDFYWLFCDGDDNEFKKWTNAIQQFNGSVDNEIGYVEFSKLKNANLFIENFLVPQIMAKKLAGDVLI